MTAASAHDRRPPQAARRGGNVASIIINAVMLYLLDIHPGWRSISFLTPAAAQVTGLVNLTLWAGIASNAVYFAAEPRWLRAIGDLTTLTIALVTLIRVLGVFPFAFHGSAAFVAVIVRAVLIAGTIGASIGIIYSIAVLIRTVTRTSR